MVPRQVLPGQTLFITRRCTQRQFLLRPDDKVNQALEYCLAEAAMRFGVTVLWFMAMSNHALCAAAHNVCYPHHLVMRSDERRPKPFELFADGRST
jgi:hypothetical protein